ncbi:MAG: class I SAM-dependent methyltransferase [Candidatus Geothermarchaeales archaeon]
MSSSIFESYLRKTDIRKLLEELNVLEAESLIKEIEHFTEKEAGKRDQIVVSYFGEPGVKRITDAIVSHLLSPPKLEGGAEVLDVGAGSGFFTVRVVEKLRQHLPEASFYAMDITPAMLRALARKTSEITPLLGLAENIAGSIEHACQYIGVPEKFDAIFSTLMLHHCPNIHEVFESMRDALKDHGKSVVIDLCEHAFEEFREEMGDVHLGFNTSEIEEKASKHFSKVKVEKIPGIRCESSGRSAELFVAVLMC